MHNFTSGLAYDHSIYSRLFHTLSVQREKTLIFELRGCKLHNLCDNASTLLYTLMNEMHTGLRVVDKSDPELVIPFKVSLRRVVHKSDPELVIPIKVSLRMAVVKSDPELVIPIKVSLRRAVVKSDTEPILQLQSVRAGLVSL
jgi:hypothetical protein